MLLIFSTIIRYIVLHNGITYCYFHTDIYQLDGIDGKQARRLGVSGPLGEMFDHGLDSYIVFFIPYSLISVFGRDEYSIPVFR